MRKRSKVVEVIHDDFKLPEWIKKMPDRRCRMKL